MNIAFVTHNYPSAERPDDGSFVRNLAQQIGKDASVTVIAPRAIRSMGGLRGLRTEFQRDESVDLLRPGYLTYSARRIPGGFSTFRLTARSFRRSAVRAGKNISPRADLVHGHFLFPSGSTAVALARRYGVPATVALGESTPAFYEHHFGIKRAATVAREMRGILAVSEKNRGWAVDELKVDPARVLVLPNAADVDLFYPRRRAEVRRELGLPPDLPIVISVGGFTERKGTLRVMEAIGVLPDVSAVFLGSGPDKPEGDRVLFAGAVDHDSVPRWLSAADIFVFPTRAEGSPNAVAEALACGLPVVGSDIPPMQGLVGDDAGILVPADDISGISGAIARLVGDQDLRDAMSRAALNRANSFTLAERSQRVMQWFQEVASS